MRGGIAFTTLVFEFYPKKSADRLRLLYGVQRPPSVVDLKSTTLPQKPPTPLYIVLVKHFFDVFILQRYIYLYEKEIQHNFNRKSTWSVVF
jgi:hypothetical protein